MEVKKAIKLPKDLPADTGLDSEENWNDSPETKQWRLDALEAVKVAVQALNQGKVVGTMELNEKTYKITE
jgi:hypothetical protein